MSSFLLYLGIWEDSIPGFQIGIIDMYKEEKRQHIEDLPKSLESSSMWFIFILVLFKPVCLFYQPMHHMQPKTVKNFLNRNPKKEEMKLNRKKMKLAVLCNVCLERQSDKRELMFLNSWWMQQYIYKGRG